MAQKIRVRRMRNRLLELMQEKERKYGRRVKQKEIAEFAQITEHTVMNWLRNKITRYETEVVERLCDYFDCELCDLLYFEVSYEDLPEDPDQMRDSS